MDYTFSLPQNAATESGKAGIEIVLGKSFFGVSVFGLFLARGGHQTMKRSISIYHSLQANRCSDPKLPIYRVNATVPAAGSD